MTSNNPSFVLNKVNDTTFEERDVPTFGDKDVLIEVKKTGICGSDVHYLTHGAIGDFVVKKPMVLGHESAGIVAKVGKGVSHVKPGDRVALEPGRSCRFCDYCKSGRYELCADMAFAATPPYDGTLARYYVLPGDLAYKLPDNLSLEDGALMEPLSVAVHACTSLAQLRTNATVAVFGAGPVGLLTMAVAKALGAKRIIGIDVVQPRLDFAKQHSGATDVFLPPAPEGNEKEKDGRMGYSRRAAGELVQKLGLLKDEDVDVVFDASGAEVCIQMGLFLVKRGGTFVQIGMGAPDVTIPIAMLITKQLKLQGCFRYGPGDYKLAISLAATGKIDLKPYVTHRYAFKDAVTAFETTKTGKSQDGKGVIKAIIDGPAE